MRTEFRLRGIYSFTRPARFTEGARSFDRLYDQPNEKRFVRQEQFQEKREPVFRAELHKNQRDRALEVIPLSPEML